MQLNNISACYCIYTWEKIHTFHIGALNVKIYKIELYVQRDLWTTKITTKYKRWFLFDQVYTLFSEVMRKIRFIFNWTSDKKNCIRNSWLNLATVHLSDNLRKMHRQHFTAWSKIGWLQFNDRKQYRIKRRTNYTICVETVNNCTMPHDVLNLQNTIGI